MVYSGKKYALTETQIKKIARLCVQEQGSVDGCKAEASLMANLLETSKSRQNKYGTDAAGLYNWVREGGWFSRAAYYMDNGSAAKKHIDAVRDVLVEGNRTLPQYVDEHDCFSDINSISTGSIKNRADYIPNKTVIKNRYGSTYTFFCFPASGSDPFGYTKEAYEYVMGKGAIAKVPDTRSVEEITVEMPVIKRGDEGDAVSIWQLIVGSKIDGDFGPATQAATVKWQVANGLKGDGIVGGKSWKKGLEQIS